MKEYVIREIFTNNIEDELIKIGFDSSYYKKASDKFRYKNIKIYNLTPAEANILKQTAISVGAECATNRNVITGKIDLSNTILGGSFSEIEKVAEKLKYQPFGLKTLGEQLKNCIIKAERNTKLVGILNVTPDSFSDGGLYNKPHDCIKHLLQLIEDGADIIDIGAESTRPYSTEVPPAEQIVRLKPIFEFINKENLNMPISVDTRSAEVADFVLNNGAFIINDVSGFDYDNKMPEIVSKYNAGVIIQHSKNTPDKMQNAPHYNDVVEEIYFSLKNKKEFAESLGISNIILDVGIGFGKTKEHNFELLERIEEFTSLKSPLMVGISRKSLLGVIDESNDVKDTMTLAISYPLAKSGIDYLRVHNVKLHRELLNCIKYIKNAKSY